MRESVSWSPQPSSHVFTALGLGTPSLGEFPLAQGRRVFFGLELGYLFFHSHAERQRTRRCHVAVLPGD